MESIACRSVRVRPGRRVRALAGTALVLCLPLLAAIVLIAVTVAGAHAPWGIVGVLSAISVLAIAVLASAHPAPGHVIELIEGAIRVRPPSGVRRGVHLARVVRAARVEDAYAPAPDRLVLRLENGGGVDAELESESAQKVLEHLGVTLKQRTLRVPLRGTLDTFFIVLVVWFVTWLGTLLPMNVLHLAGPLYAFAISMTLSLLAAIVCGVWLRPNATVGLDGIRITGVVHPKFIPYSSIKTVAREQGADSGIFRGGFVVLGTSSGEVRLFASGQTHEQVDALYHHIERGRAASAAVDAPRLELLDRRGRAVGAWRDALDKMLLGGGGFRDVGLGQVELDDVLNDPGAALERRVAAALALRSRDGEAQRRIRVAAATSADPHVRVALDAAGADEIDDRKIARALDEAEERAALRTSPANPEPES